MKLLPILLAGLLAGCGESGVTVNLPEKTGLPSDDERTLRSAWPRALGACPGLSRYGDRLYVERVEAYDFEAGKLINVVVRAGEDANVERFGLGKGERCYFGFTDNAKRLKLSKSGCIRICADEEGRGWLGDITVDLEK